MVSALARYTINLSCHSKRVWRLMEVIMHVVCLCQTAHTHTHSLSQRNPSIFSEFYFSVSLEQKKRGLKETLVIPLSHSRPEGRWKVGVIHWIPSIPSTGVCPPRPPLCALLDPSSCPLFAVYPKRGHRHPSSDYFCVPAHCLELSGSLPDLNMAFRQLNMAFVMDGWQLRASILG